MRKGELQHSGAERAEASSCGSSQRWLSALFSSLGSYLWTATHASCSSVSFPYPVSRSADAFADSLVLQLQLTRAPLRLLPAQAVSAHLPFGVSSFDAITGASVGVRQIMRLQLIVTAEDQRASNARVRDTITQWRSAWLLADFSSKARVRREAFISSAAPRTCCRRTSSASNEGQIGALTLPAQRAKLNPHRNVLSTSLLIAHRPRRQRAQPRSQLFASCPSLSALACIISSQHRFQSLKLR